MPSKPTQTSAAARVILKEGVSRDEIDDVIAARGWRLCNIAPADVGRPAQIICVSAAGTDLIYVIHDVRLDALYVAIAGPDQARLEADVRASFPAYPPEEIKAMTTSLEPQTFLRGLAYAALTAPLGGSPWLVSAIRAGLMHKRADVRGSTLVVAAYAAWPDVQALVRGAMKHEKDEAVRAQAGTLIDSWGAT
jgi:hypothetical protein